MSYLTLYREGGFKKTRDILFDVLKECTLCPRKCRVDRLKGETGFCHSGKYARLSSAFLHFGEEPELVGSGGSGTIFFSYCNLGCLYCQNYTISHLGEGKDFKPDELANTMLFLQKQGAENINFVTPTHFMPQVIEALLIATEEGLTLPLVYNCGGYEGVEVLKAVSGIFDIYMPDIKYSEEGAAKQFSRASDYWEVARAATKQMHAQVGDLVVEGGVAKGGLLIRHLVLPQKLAGSFKILDFVKEELSTDTYINIMQQYHPCYQADEHEGLQRRITLDEHREVVEYARKLGLHRGF